MDTHPSALATSVPALSAGAVHVWMASLARAAPDLDHLNSLLAPDERQRAARFLRGSDRDAFIARRGLLRVLVAAYAGLDPAHVVFAYGPTGKPALQAPMLEHQAATDIRFSLSSSDGLALYAFTLGRALGIDVERLRLIDDLARAAARFFSAAEQAALSSLPPERTVEAFFACWTRKEAYLKATGEGLSRSLSSFDVSLVPGEPARLLRVAADPREAAHWRLETLTPAPGYLAALAVAGQNWHLSTYEWQPEHDAHDAHVTHAAHVTRTDEPLAARHDTPRPAG